MTVIPMVETTAPTVVPVWDRDGGNGVDVGVEVEMGTKTVTADVCKVDSAVNDLDPLDNVVVVALNPNDESSASNADCEADNEDFAA